MEATSPPDMAAYGTAAVPLVMVGGYVAPPRMGGPKHAEDPQPAQMSTHMAAALAYQAMGLGAQPYSEGVKRAPSPARLLSWTAPPLSPRPGQRRVADEELPPVAPAEEHGEQPPEPPITSWTSPDFEGIGEVMHASVSEDAGAGNEMRRFLQEKGRDYPAKSAQCNSGYSHTPSTPNSARRTQPVSDAARALRSATMERTVRPWLLQSRRPQPGIHGADKPGIQSTEKSDSSKRRVSPAPSSASLAPSTARTRGGSPVPRPVSRRYRMSDLLYSQFSPTRYPETAVAAQRSPMRSAVASQGLPEGLIPKWNSSPLESLQGSRRSASPPGSRLPGWTRGTCRSASPPGSPTASSRRGLLASNNCLHQLKMRQSDEHAEEQISKVLAQEQRLHRQWTSSELRFIREELRSPTYRDAAKSPSALARRVKSPPRC